MEPQGRSRELTSSFASYVEPPEEPRRLITTFYSFKGGVGRSMALQGAAMALAERRQRVLMVDADIEAPGLSLAHKPPNAGPLPGFADLAGDVAQRILQVLDGRLEASSDLFADLPELVNSYSSTIAEGRVSDRELEKRIEEVAREIGFDVPPRGCVALLPVGTVLEDYSTAVERLALTRLFDLQGPDAPWELVEAVGLPVDVSPPAKPADVFAHVLRRALLQAHVGGTEAAFDHVFVDSRTGLADVAGLCVRWLADRLVFVTGLNKQNIDGTRYMLDCAGLSGEDRDRVTIAVGPVPASELQMLDERLKELRKALGLTRNPFLLHYEPWVALSDQPLAERYVDHTRLHHEYRRLAEHIARRAGMAPSDALHRVLSRLRADGPDWGAAAEFARAALTDISTARAALSSLGAVLATSNTPPARRVPLLRVATALAPDDWQARGMLANALGDEAKTAGPSRAGHLYEQANAIYQSVSTARSSSPVLWYNWGITLDDWARALLPTDRDRALSLYEEAGAKCAQAVDIEADKHEAWNNWGVTLGHWAEALLPIDRDRALRLYEEAAAKHAQALHIKPADNEVWYNWGVALAEWARALLPTDRDRALRLLEEASAKCARAVDIRPDFHAAWVNWGRVLTSLWRITHDRALLDEAGRTLARAGELDPEATSYDLTCLAALRGDPDEAFSGLEAELRANGITWDYVAQDPDWNELRGDERYKRLQETYGS